MKQIVVNNHKFDYEIGLGLLKLKSETNPFPEAISKTEWKKVKPLTFKDIAKFKNIEQRRIGIFCLGLERLVKEINPVLVSSKTINKTTTWINREGKLETKQFKDTYNLFKVKGETLAEGLEDNWRRVGDAYYIQFKDTSTDREYLIWVDVGLVAVTNGGSRWNLDSEIGKLVNPISCIAWTIQTDVPKGNIEKIIRQGDCILIKPKGEYEPLDTPRHLTEKEYRELHVAES